MKDLSNAYFRRKWSNYLQKELKTPNKILKFKQLISYFRVWRKELETKNLCSENYRKFTSEEDFE